MAKRNPPITPVKLPEQAPTRSGLGALVENTLIRFLGGLVNLAGETISEIIEWGLEIFIEAVEEALIDVNAPMIRRVIANLPADSPIIPYLSAMIETKSLAGIASLGGFAGSMGMSAAGSLLNILLRPAGYEVDSLLRTARLDPSAAIAGLWKEVLSRPEMLDQLSDLGWSDGNIAVWETILRPVLSEADLLTLLLREEISEGEARIKLEKRGYAATQIDDMLRVMRPLSSPDDLRTLLFRGIISPGAFGDRLKHHGYNDTQVNELQQVAWNLLSPGDIVELHKRGEIEEGEVVRRLEAHGFPPEVVANILKVSPPLTPLGDLSALYWREVLTESAFKERITQYGYTEDQVAEITELTHRIPGPGDLISMAVREAFRPALIEEYNYLAEFPEEFAEWMEKQGFEREWAEKYWVAHWRLPSLTMAYGMFHRRIINEEELERLFAVSDIAPFWRPKLAEAAYRPLTRVDVRRMYGLGVLSESAIFDSYLDLGYNPENAGYMTEFTIRYTTETERDATKSDILRTYTEGIITAGTATNHLLELGYSDTWAGYYIALEDVKIVRKYLSQEISLLKLQYTEGIIDRSSIFAILGELNVPDGQIRNYLKEWDIIIERTVSLPSVGQLESFLKQDVIGEGTYREQMSMRHYGDAAVSWFLQEIRVQIVAEALKEEERAKKEESRIALAEVKTTYDVEKSQIDVYIAELKTALAENNVVLGIIVDLELIDEIFRQNDQMKLRIVELQEEKARTKLALTEELRGMRPT